MVVTTTNPTKTQQPDAIQVLHDEIWDLRSKMAAQAEQVQRIQRTSRVDEKEFNIGKMQSERRVLDAVSALTRVVGTMTYQQVDAQTRCDQQGAAVWQSNKEARQREVRHNINHIRYLMSQERQPTYLCPCGQHFGMRFVDSLGTVIVDNMCPKDWWISMSRLAFDEGKLSQFNAECKYDDFLAVYKIA
jgi:hypothetical protein